MLPLIPILPAQTTHPHSSSRLVASVVSAAPGKPFLAAIEIKMDPTWHTYWINPGDSGIPPSIDWRLPKGWKAGPILWPTPRRIEQGGLVSYGYEKCVLLPFEITPPPSASNPAELKGVASWLICQRACVPASEELELPIDVGKEVADPVWSKALLASFEALPSKSGNLAFAAVRKGEEILLDVRGVDLPSGIAFYPEDETIEPAAKQTVAKIASGLEIGLRISQFASGKIERLRGLLIPPKGARIGDHDGAVVVNTPIVTGEK